MTLDKGIRTLIPGVVLPDEEKEMAEARAAVKAKLGKLDLDRLDSEFKLQAAPTPPINVEISLPKETKDEYGYTPTQNKEIEKYLARPKVNSDGAWKRFVEANKEADKVAAKKAADKKHLKDLIVFGLENSSDPVVKNPVMRKALEAKPKPRQENTVERIERIMYEQGETDKRPKHLTNKNIYSFEDQFSKNSRNINDYKPKKIKD